MSESGCLHSSKFENVKVEKHISSKDIIITEEITIGETEDHVPVIDNNGISTEVLTTEYSFDNKVDVAGSTLQYVPLESDQSYAATDPSPGWKFSHLFNNYFSKKKAGVETVSLPKERFYYVKWPAGTILKELTIIPNLDIKSSGISDTANTKTKFKNELVVNLLTSSVISDDVLDDATNVNYDRMDTDRAMSTVGAKLIGHFPYEYSESVENSHSYGYAYLIREFPIISCAISTNNYMWRKYTPISVIRDMGQPIGLTKDTNLEPVSQHSTSSTTLQLKHGSYVEETGTPHGSITNCLRVDGQAYGAADPMNINNKGFPGLFSFSTAYRNVGPRTFSAENDGTSTISDTYTNLACNATHSTVLRDNHRSGMFYNSGTSDLGLVLTIGHTADKGQNDSAEIFNDLGTLTQKDGTNFNSDTNDLRFKAIFTFVPLSS